MSVMYHTFPANTITKLTSNGWRKHFGTENIFVLQAINKNRPNRAADMTLNTQSSKKGCAPQKITEKPLPTKSILKKTLSTPIKGVLTRDNSIDISDESDDIRRSFYENLDPNIQLIEQEPELTYENDTFHLTKDSVLFDKVSKNQFNDCLNQDTSPQMVKIREREIAHPNVGSIVLNPVIHHVSDDSIQSSKEILKNFKIVEEDETRGDIDDGKLRVKSEESKQQNANNQLAIKHDELSKTSNRNMKSEDTISKSKPDIRVRVTGIVNRTELTTITAMNNKSFVKLEADESAVPDRNTNSIKSVRELKVRKEVEVSKDYELVGKYQTPSKDKDEDSFSGSDKEVDEIIVFSEDEGLNTQDYDTDSSSHSLELSTKVYITLTYA